MLSLNKLSFGILKDTKSDANSQKNIEKSKLLKLNEVIQVDFPDSQYCKEVTNKTMICLHHTVSGQGVNGDIAWWRKTADRIGTAIIIGWDGKIYQCFSSKYWAYHLGVDNVSLNKSTIGIEIDSWGGLVKDGTDYYPAMWDTVKKKHIANKAVSPIKNVQTYEKPYRGFSAYEKYTDAQIESVRKLLIYWNGVYKIPLNYNPDMWDYSERAMNGVPGIWSHVSYRKDKSDCHPQSELIQMLKSL